MASGNGIEVAKAYVTIIPSMEGSQKTISQELTGVTEPAAKEAGESSGKKFGESLADGLKTTGAVIAGAMAAATGAAVALGKGFIEAANDVSELGDTIDKESQKMNISATAYQEWDFIMQHAGTSIDGMKTSMKRLTIAAEEGNEAFSALGISEETLSAMSPEETFNATISALQGVADEGERTALASELLGKGAVELAPLFNMTAEETDALRQQVHDLGGVMSDEAVKDAAAYQDAMQNMNVALDGVKNNMMSQFLPAMSTTMEGLANIFSGADVEGGLSQIEEGITGLADNIVAKAPEIFSIGGSIIKALASSVVKNLPTLLSSVLPVMTDLFTTFVELAPEAINAVFELVNGVLDWLVNGDGLTTILTGIGVLITSLTTALSENIGTIIPLVVQGILSVITTLTSPDVMIPMLQAGLTLLMELLNGIISAIPMLIQQLPTIISNITTTLLQGLPLILQAGIQIFMAIVEAIPVILESLVQVLPDIINTIVEFTVKSIPLFLEASIQLLMAIIQAIPTIIVALVQNIPSIVSTIISTLLKNLPLLIQGAIQLLMGIITAIPTIIVELGKQLPTIISAIVEGLADGIGQIVSVGGDLIRGLWQGISDMASWIGEKIKGFGEGIVDGLKNFFGIASPSKLFENVIGKNLALGIGEGFEDEIGNVEDEMVDSMDGLTTNMSADVSAYASQADSLAGNTTNYNGGAVTINVYGAEGQNVNDLAESIANRFEHMTRRKGAVYA